MDLTTKHTKSAKGKTIIFKKYFVCFVVIIFSFVGRYARGFKSSAELKNGKLNAFRVHAGGGPSGAPKAST
jgi:hypothetical protein